MIKRIFLSTVLCITLFSTYVYAVDFSSSAALEDKGVKKYKAIQLTQEIYNNTKENKADIEVFDKDNEAVPYFINSFVEKGTETKKTYEMKLINSFVKDEFYYFDYAIRNPQKEDVIATSIEVQTDKKGFAKKLELWGGYDNINWEKVQDDILYNVEDNKKLALQFSNTRKYTYYRFKILNNLEKVSFSSVVLNYLNSTQSRDYFTNTVFPEFTTEENGKKTVIKIQNLKNLKLDSITLETDSIFKRTVNFEGRKSNVLYNLVFNDTNYKDTTIKLDGYKVKSDTVEISIDNKDDKPIKVTQIQAKYLFDELVFDGSKAGDFTLKFGNSELSNPKIYDIANYKEQILKEGYDILNIKQIKIEPTQMSDAGKQYDYKLIFNIVISAVAIMMGILIFLKLKKQVG